MRKILLLILFIPIIVSAQTFKSKKDSLRALKDTIPLLSLPFDSSGNVTYKLIETIPGASKNDLYNRAKIWIALNFKSAKDVMQLDDKETGNIVMQAVSEQFYTYKYWGSQIPIIYNLYYTVRFTIKDAKFRLIISNFSTEHVAYNAAIQKDALEFVYKKLKDWNINAKNGQMQFNRQDDNLGGPNKVRPQFDMLNNIALFADDLVSKANVSLSKPAKADDF